MKISKRLDLLVGDRARSDDAVQDIHILEPNTDALAEKHAHDSAEARITPPSSVEKEADRSLFHSPIMSPSVDFQSEDGFKQAAGKKKKAAKNKFNWEDNDDEDGNKKDEGEGNNGGDKGGDAGAGGSDDKKDAPNGDGDGNGNGDGNQDDAWDSFLPAKSKKKGKKGKIEEVSEPKPAVKEKVEDFHEIKLNDDAPVLDLDFESGTKSSSGFGAWGSSWNTGTTR